MTDYIRDGLPYNGHENIHDRGSRYCHGFTPRSFTWECQDFSLKMWPHGRRNFHYHSLRSDLLRTPNADGLVESLGPIGENHCWTTERKRCNYRGAASGWLHLVFSDISYELHATRVCLFVCLFVEMHANINPIIRCLLFNFSFLRICFAYRWEKSKLILSYLKYFNNFVMLIEKKNCIALLFHNNVSGNHLDDLP